MSAYKSKLVEHYDSLFAPKDYKGEAALIYRLCGGPIQIQKILDIGCGTGSHLPHLLLNASQQITGIDISREMIDKAKEKNLSSQINFIHGEVQSLKGNKFDLAISMFNVINHLDSIQELKLFFKSVRECLYKNSKFIFDCWNGVAALREEPRSNQRIIESAVGGHFILKQTPQTNLLTGHVEIENQVDVYYLEERVDSFTYTLDHWLWTPSVLSELLAQSGFIVEGIYKHNLTEIESAVADDFKVIFMATAI